MSPSDPIAREKEIEKIPLKHFDKSKWPDDIRTIGIDELEGVGIDNNNILYWDGKPIKIRQRLELSLWHGLLAFLAAVGTFGSFVIDFLKVLGV